MPLEIERKFLLKSDVWRAVATGGKRYRQGYLSTDKERTVRVRVEGDQGRLTVKGPSVSATRSEYEYAIPLQDAEEMLENLCLRPLVHKTRYRIPHGRLTFEIDEFGGENQGLVLAEVEIESENQCISLPDWIGEEVTPDPRYYNANLVAHPFTTWEQRGHSTVSP